MANEAISAGLYSWMQAQARRITEGLGSALSVTVTYDHVTGHTMASSTLQITESKTSASVTAHRIETAARPGAQQRPSGSVVFLIDKARLDTASITTPTRADRITESGDTYQVLDWSLCAGELRYAFHCDRVAS